MASGSSRLDPDRFRAGARDANRYRAIVVFVAAAGMALLVFGSAAAVSRDIPPALVFAVAAVVVISGVGAMRWFDNLLARRARDVWAEAADAFDLLTGIDEQNAVPTIGGAIDGRKLDIRLTSEQNYADGKEIVRTVFEAQLAERLAAVELALRDTVYFRESEGVPLGERGDIRVYGAVSESEVDQVDGPDLCDRLLKAASRFELLHVANGAINAEWTGAPRSTDDLIEAIETLVDIADHLEEAFGPA